MTPDQERTKRLNRKLCKAAFDGDASAVAAALNAGADPNGLYRRRTSAMDFAVINEQVHIVHLLMDVGVVVTDTHMAMAAELGRSKIIRVLLGAGVPSDDWYFTPTKGERTPLIAAAESGRLDIVKMLLNAGANPNMCGLCWATALRSAAESNHHKIVRLLFRAGTVVRPWEAELPVVREVLAEREAARLRRRVRPLEIAQPDGRVSARRL